MIKSKIDARERALESSVAFCRNYKASKAEDVVLFAKMFEAYLIGDAELPETEPSVEDVTNKAIERIFSAYGLNGGEEVKPRANAVSGFPIGGIVPQSEE